MDKSVLVVEDNLINQRLFTALLAAEGFHDILVAEDGLRGMELARECKPRLIIMDVQLPHLSGLDATRSLKADGLTRLIPIIIVTAHAEPGDEAKIMGTGCDSYMAKPISAVQFRALLRSFLSAERAGA